MKLLLLAAALFYVSLAHSQSGVLVPKDKDHPDPAILSLEEMKVNIVIDNGDARVYITQIFANHTSQVEEGNYTFALPTGSTVSDFAVWDGPVRIPAVILERKRAEEAYSEARDQAIDPGLLEAGERDGSDPKADSTFTAHITPIPAYGTKRLELEYHQNLKSIASSRASSSRSSPQTLPSRTPLISASTLNSTQPSHSPASISRVRHSL